MFVDISLHIWKHTLLRSCTCARVCALCSFTLGDECGEVQLVYTGHLLMAWGFLLYTLGNVEGLSVFPFFLTGVECMWVYAWIYAGTHTHTLQVGYSESNVSPGVGTRHLEGPKNPDGLNVGISVFVYVYKVHLCLYLLRGRMRSWKQSSGITIEDYGLWTILSAKNKYMLYQQ